MPRKVTKTGNYKKVVKTRKNILTGRTRTTTKRKIPVYNKDGSLKGYTKEKIVLIDSPGKWHKTKTKKRGIGGRSKEKEVVKGGGRIYKKKSNVGGSKTRYKRRIMRGR